jgi:hypothetical protein
MSDSTTVTKRLVSGFTTETTPVLDAQGREHWVEQFTDETGRPAGITVRHPFGSTPKVCTLHKAATFGDALGCVETFGTERHP